MKNNIFGAFFLSLLLLLPAHAAKEVEIVKCDVCTNANCPVGSQDAKNFCYIVYSKNLPKPECSGWKEPNPLPCGKYPVYTPAPTVAPAPAPTQTWVCENAWGYRYFSSMMKCKGMEEDDGSCNFNSSGSLAMGCKYDYSLPPLPKTAPTPVVTLTPPAESKTPPPEIDPMPVVAPPPPTTLALLKEAEAEKKAALASTASLKETLSGIKTENLSVANQLKTGKMDIASYAKWNPYSSKVSGDSGEGGEYTYGSMTTGRNGKSDRSETSKNRQRSDITEKSSTFDQEGRDLASGKTGDQDSLSAAGKNSKTGASKNGSSDEKTDAWIAYLEQKEKANLLAQLRMDPKLRDQLKAKIDELLARGEQNSSTFGFLSDLYEESAVSDPNSIAGLNAMSAREAFSMDDEETRRQIHDLLSELEHSDPQFLPQESLFERIQWAHKKFAKKEMFQKNKK